MFTKTLITGCLLTGLVVAVVVFVLMIFLVKLMWAWTIPDLFPGAVDQGLVAGDIGWLTSVKVALMVAVLSAFAKGSGNARLEKSKPAQ